MRPLPARLQRLTAHPWIKHPWVKPLFVQSQIFAAATLVSLSVVGLRCLGILQPLELGVIDQHFRWRPIPARDDRVIIVGITEKDIEQLQGWPTNDATLAKLLETIKAARPKVIGLDIYRNVPIAPGQAPLNTVFQTTPNLVGIEFFDPTGPVPPPPALAKRNQVGFNNVVVDIDQRVRRSILYSSPDGRSPSRESFALKIALQYLQPLGIQPKTAASYHPKALQLGKAVMPPLQESDSVYVKADVSGYQILADYQGPVKHFQYVTINAVLAGEVSPAMFRDRIVLIGSMAESLKDYMATPYSNINSNSTEMTYGVEVQANLISQLLNAALTGRGVFRSWPEPIEWLMVWVFAYWGTYTSWRLRSPERTMVAMSLTSLGLFGAVYAAFLNYWILPVGPPLIALLTASIGVTSYIAHSQEELKRSKEFLHRIINSIPDPIFVKDRYHRWIVLNQAYADFIGMPIDDLRGRTAAEVFSIEQSEQIQAKEDQVFATRSTLESEEEFTNLTGQRYHVATKRSLHKDGGGNLFLVGVIHDITDRKSLEEELKRTRDRLSHDNSQLSYLANHDPLTGLPNRKLFQERVRQTIDQTEPNHQQFALLFLDLDGFKQVNDSRGHAVGDLLLQAVAKRLSASLRASDTVARIGGDEFVIIVPNIPGVIVAKRVAKKILTALAEEFTLDEHIIHVTTSIGISMYPTDSSDMERLIQKADEAMYKAKQAGKNQFAIAQTSKRIVSSSIG
jgi:diguanylate cyclase (GGDEF)-like protein/PAS domain S-box-containing protein